MSKHRSAHRKRHDRARAARAARRVQAHPLRALDVPYRGYDEWISVPEGTPAGLPDGLDQDVRAFHATVVRLAPLYAGTVPLAAVYLDGHIARGVLPVAAPGRPDRVSLVPLEEIAAHCALQGLGQDSGASLHELHFHGALVLDDDHVIRLAQV